MIGKTKIGKTFKGCLKYVMTKEGAELLDYQHCRVKNYLQATDDFNIVRAQKPSISNAVWHTSLSFAYPDKVSNELIKSVANDYLKLMGMQDCQFVMVRHHDTRHHHVHLVINRIQPNGKIISDQFCKNRTARTCDQLEEKYKLTVARQVNRISKKDKVPEKQIEKNHIRDSIIEFIKLHKHDPKLEINSFLKTKGIELIIARQSTGRINGVVFKYNGHSYKGSSLGKEFKFAKLAPYLPHEIRSANQLKETKHQSPANFSKTEPSLIDKLSRSINKTLGQDEYEAQMEVKKYNNQLPL